jgi:DNA-binding FadR family transcriptional regulator
MCCLDPPKTRRGRLPRGGAPGGCCLGLARREVLLKNVGVRTYPERGMHGEIVHSLGFDIVAGRLAPGTALVPERVGETFNASRTVVREAFKVLAGKGLLDSIQKRGTFVTPPPSWNRLDPDVLNWHIDAATDPSTLESVSEVRLAIEPFVAGLAATRRNDDNIQRMTEALSLMEQACRPESRDAALLSDADTQFHRALFDSIKNEILTAFFEVMQSGLATRNRMVHSNFGVAEETIREHRHLLNAIIAQKPTRAEKHMRNLIQSGQPPLSPRPE